MIFRLRSGDQATAAAFLWNSCVHLSLIQMTRVSENLPLNPDSENLQPLTDFRRNPIQHKKHLLMQSPVLNRKETDESYTPRNRGRRTPASRQAGQRIEACESRSLLSASPAAVVVGEFADAGTVSEELISTEVLTENQDIDFEALITECWEVKPLSLDGIDEGLG